MQPGTVLTFFGSRLLQVLLVPPLKMLVCSAEAGGPGGLIGERVPLTLFTPQSSNGCKIKDGKEHN